MVQQFSVDPPAGLSFDNLRPCLNFGQGYEAQMLGQNYPDAVGLPSFNCKMRASRGVRVVRFYQQSNARSWSKWKLYLGKQNSTQALLTLLIKCECYRWEKASSCCKHKWFRSAKVFAGFWDRSQILWWISTNCFTPSCLQRLYRSSEVFHKCGLFSFDICNIFLVLADYCYIMVLIQIKLTRLEIHLCI